jgi:hypothetical protein
MQGIFKGFYSSPRELLECCLKIGRDCHDTSLPLEAVDGYTSSVWDITHCQLVNNYHILPCLYLEHFNSTLNKVNF